MRMCEGSKSQQPRNKIIHVWKSCDFAHWIFRLYLGYTDAIEAVFISQTKSIMNKNK